jgi:hypothetical protein
MPEFFADAALYYHPRDGDDLAAQMHRVLTAGSEECATRRETLRTRARQFQWRETAERTIEQLTLAAAGVSRLSVPEWSGEDPKTGPQIT